MKDVHFESSTLWQQTLGATRDEERLRLSYLATRDIAKVLLAELGQSTPNFTVHDITHVDALWETASMLCGSSVTLTPAEGYVLGCAFILHDAAMGAASYQESVRFGDVDPFTLRGKELLAWRRRVQMVFQYHRR